MAPNAALPKLAVPDTPIGINAILLGPAGNVFIKYYLVLIHQLNKHFLFLFLQGLERVLK